MRLGICMKRWLCSIIIMLFSTSTFAQVQKFGNVDKRQVEEINTSIPAEVLFDHGKFELGDQLMYTLKRHIRLKIHSREGFEWATFEIPFNESEEQSVEKLEAITYALDSKGKVKKHRLDEKVVEIEDLPGSWRQLKFTMPNISEGAIIEIRYMYKMKNPSYLGDWEFDHFIPVRWSELEAIIPLSLDFSLVSRLNADFYINEVKETTMNLNFDYTPEMGYETSQKRIAKMKSPAQHYKWVVKDSPAIRKEPQIASIDNYRSKLFLQFSAMSLPGQYYEEYANSWSDVSEDLSEDEEFGMHLRSQKWSRDVVSKLLVGLDDDREKMEKIFDHVFAFSWNGERDFYINSDLKQVYDSRTGNSAELNLLLVNLLNEAGFKAFPMLVSTRSFGRVSQNFVLPNQFNHVVAVVESNGQNIVMDILNKYRTTLIPTYLVNGSGLVVDRYTPRWVNLEQPTSTQTKIKYDLEMLDESSFNGKVFFSSLGYDALEKQADIQNMGEESFVVQTVLSGMQNPQVDCRIEEQPEFFSSALKLHANVDFKVASSDSDLISISPVTYKLIDQNPFTAEDRQLPIEFEHTFTRTSQVDIKIPVGYTIEELPQTKSIRLPGKSLSYIESYSENENVISVIRRVVVGRKLYEADDYFVVKKIFEVANADEVDQIVLRKTEEMSESFSKH